MSEETLPLLGDASYNPKPSITVNRLITVEPLTFIFSLASTPGRIIVEQYVFASLARSYNYTPNANTPDGSTCDSSNNASSNIAAQQKTQQQSALMMELFQTSLVLPTVCTTIIIGFISQQMGRKVAMMLPLVGGLLKTALMIVIILFDLPPYLIFIPFLLDGILGALPTFLSGVFAYVTDVTDKSNRTIRLGVLMVAYRLGSLVGLFSSGYLIAGIGYTYTYVIIIGLYMLGTLYCIFVKETISKKGKVVLLSFQPFVQVYQVFFKNTTANRRWKLQICSLLVLISGQLEASLADIQTYFVLGNPLCWTSEQVGIYNAEYLAVGILGLYVAVKLFGKCVTDEQLLLLGSLSGVAACVYYTFVRNTAMMYLVPVIGAFQTVCNVVPASISSKLVHPEELGALYGAFNSLTLLLALVAILLYNSLYAATLTVFVGTAFLTMAAEHTINFIISLILVLRSRKEEKTSQDKKKVLPNR